MCIIVDACVAALVFRDPTADYRPVHEAIFRGGAVAVHGGKLTEEYARDLKVRRIVAKLDSAGRAKLLPRSVVEEETERLKRAKTCRSNDCHVIAIAKIGKIRVLCSKDADLCEDFKDKKILDEPRGKVYRNESHTHLLREHCLNRG